MTRYLPSPDGTWRPLVRLGSALPSFDAISTVGIIQDVPTRASDLYATLEMTANTVKPLVLLISDDDAFGPVLDLLEHLHGDLASHPSIIPYLNPITPLVINRGTVDKMWAAIERGLPIHLLQLWHGRCLHAHHARRRLGPAKRRIAGWTNP